MSGIFYKTVGKGKPLVFVHGLLGFHRNFFSIARSLEEDYQSLLYDQRFHGKSKKEGPFTLERLALDLKELLDSFHLKGIHLVGHSLGGYVAAYFTANYPEYVRRLVIVDSNPWPMEERFNEIKGMLSLLPEKFEKKEDMQAFFKQKVEQGLIKDKMASFLKASVDRESLRFFFHPPDILKLLEDTRSIEPVPVLKTIKTKTLFLRGENSTYFPLPDFEKLKALGLKSFLLLEIKGSAHWIHSDQPEAFKQALLKFF